MFKCWLEICAKTIMIH